MRSVLTRPGRLRESVLIVEARLEGFACESVKSLFTLCITLLLKRKYIAKVESSLISHSVVRHSAGSQKFYEKWPRHPQDVGRSLSRHHLFIRNEGDSLPGSHQLDHPAQYLIDRRGKFNPLSAGPDHLRRSRLEQVFQFASLIAFRLR